MTYQLFRKKDLENKKEREVYMSLEERYARLK